MTDNEIQLAIARYNDAINKLKLYRKNEPDSDKRNQATQKIGKYQDKIIDTAWLGIVTQTDALNTLLTDLNSIITNASNVPTLSGALNSLNSLVTKLSTDLNSSAG